MKDVFIYKSDDYYSIKDQLEGTKEYDIPSTQLNDWDLNTLVYVLEMDISHEESWANKWSSKHPEDKTIIRVIERERELLNKIKSLMKD